MVACEAVIPSPARGRRKGADSPGGAGERPIGLILKARKTPRDQRELNLHGVCIRILKDTPKKLPYPRQPVKPGRDAMTSHPLPLCLSHPPTANRHHLTCVVSALRADLASLW